MLPDPDLPPATNNRIAVANAAIKAWSARTTKVRLEYYFEGVGQISVGAFRRDFENFFGSTIFPATPEFLALYGLDPGLYDPYDVSTQHNIASTVRMTGLEFDYKQALMFLPPWARGVQVFANASHPLTGDANASSGYVRSSTGHQLTRAIQLRDWNYRGHNRRGAVTGAASGRHVYVGLETALSICGAILSGADSRCSRISTTSATPPTTRRSSAQYAGARAVSSAYDLRLALVIWREGLL